MYHDTNPLIAIAETYGFSVDVVHNACGQDLHVDYETTRRFFIGDVCIVLYRMPSGRYEATHYTTGGVNHATINDYPAPVAQAICARQPSLIRHWTAITGEAANALLKSAKTSAQRRHLLNIIAQY